MASNFLETLGIFAVMIGGSLYTVRLINAYRAGSEVWGVYDAASERIGVKVKRSLNLLSDWPNLFGKVSDRRVYVHPHKGIGSRPSKTIFASESRIELPTELIISISDTDVPEGTKEIELENINKYNYNLYAKDDIESDHVKNLFLGEAGRKINDIIEKNQEDFRAIIFEPGLVMFSTFEIEMDKENISENVRDLCDMVDTLEENSPEINEEIENPRMMQISKGSRSGVIKAIIPFLLFGIAGYMITQLMYDFSLLFLITSVILVLIGLLKLFVSFFNVWKYQ
ncbi:MAG: hypothetical protein ACOCTN_03625 [Candidatus Natronoplasma sp.]